MGLFGGKDGVTSGMKPGFRDFKWGDVPTPRMQVLDEHAESKFCWIPDDELSWDGAPLDRIVYEFWENRLAEVYVEIPAASADKMLKDLHASWGKSTQPNKFIEDFAWQNKASGPERVRGRVISWCASEVQRQLLPSRSLCHLRLFCCAGSDNVSSVRVTGIHQAASTPPSKA
jgi:hypothetical protein